MPSIMDETDKLLALIATRQREGEELSTLAIRAIHGMEQLRATRDIRNVLEECGRAMERISSSPAASR